jgi:hypothetical protein
MSINLLQRIVVSTMVALLAACGGGGGGSVSGQPTGTPSTPSSSLTLTLTAQSPKIFHFTWSDVSDETEYRLLEDPDGTSGYTTIATYSPNTTSADIEVFLPKRINAKYVLQVCKETICTDSTPATVSGNLAQSIGYIKASNTRARSLFGTSIALSSDGSTLAIGDEYESSNATGVGGNQDSYASNRSGAVYVFTKTGTTWSQQAYIKASNSAPGILFGSSVSLSSDGNTLAVGARGESSEGAGVDGTGSTNYINYGTNSGATYVFTRSGTTWSQQVFIKASYPHMWGSFGIRTSLSADGNTLAVSALDSARLSGINNVPEDFSSSASGAVYIFTRSGTAWTQQAYIKASNSFDYIGFGMGMSLSADGNTLAVGAYGEHSNATGINGSQTNYLADKSGAVYVFTRSGTAWSQEAYIKASNTQSMDYFGWSVSLSADGTTLAVGAEREGSGATGINGDQNDNAANPSGAVYVFTKSGATWSQQAYIKASNTGFTDSFGWNVALSSDGNTLAVSAYGEDSNATGINGNQADNSIYSAGAAYLYTRNNGAWGQKAYIKPSSYNSDTASGIYPYFGWSIALSGDGGTLAVSATGESSNAKGVNGNQQNTQAPGSGAVYLY